MLRHWNKWRVKRREWALSGTQLSIGFDEVFSLSKRTLIWQKTLATAIVHTIHRQLLGNHDYDVTITKTQFCRKCPIRVGFLPFLCFHHQKQTIWSDQMSRQWTSQKLVCENENFPTTNERKTKQNHQVLLCWVFLLLGIIFEISKYYARLRSLC